MIRIIALAVASILCAQGSAMACTVEGSRIAAEARQRLHFSSRRITGTFTVTSRETRISEEFGEPVEVTTYFGKITSKKGRIFETVHIDDGSILLCATTFPPRANARGAFYLARRRDSNGRYAMIDFDGEYYFEAATKN